MSESRVQHGNTVVGKVLRTALLLVLLALLALQVAAAQRGATLRGQVTDQLGDAVAGVSVTLVHKDGKEQSTETDERGTYRFTNLAPGVYSLRAARPGFANYDRSDLNLTEGRAETLDFKLTVTIENQKVTVTNGDSLSTDPANNKSALVLKGQDLDALPDDPDELAAALTALAGPAAGPSGAEMLIDGFTSGQTMPDKQAIREVVINRNPFSAEFDRIGFGRIEILTKPGAGKLHGGANLLFNNQVLNSRNPYAPNRPNFLRLPLFVNLNGPLVSNKASFFFGFARRAIDDNAVVSSTVLDSNLNLATFSRSIVTPKRFTEFYPRVDVQLDKNNTLSTRYSYTRFSFKNQGIGGFTLPSQAYDSAETDQTIQMTATSIMGPKVVNEAAFQYERYRRNLAALDSTPSVIVLDAFTGGGSPIGAAAYSQDFWELRDYATMTAARHTFKFGGRLRQTRMGDFSPTNFDGTYVFSGGKAPQLDAQNRVVSGPLVDITSIERYRRTLLFQQLGLAPAEIRAMGGGATHLTLASGNPFIGIRQIDFGGFVQDDWKLRSDFTLSMGLRYQNQTNINNNRNFAPRVAFAWTPRLKSSGPPKTVIRGGSGIFYDFIGINLTQQAERFNGLTQAQFLVTDPSVLDVFPAVPSAAALSSLAQPNTIWRKADGLVAPYTIQSSISVEQSLPHNLTVTATYLNSRGLHILRARNINAPLPGTFNPATPGSGVRPFGTLDNIYEYESSGVYKQNLLIVSSAIRPSPRLTINANYAFGKVSSDTDGQGSFPADSYDLRNEYGRASFDIRHRVTLVGNVNTWWGISVSPFIIASTGAPFNITTGLDSNGDSLFADRPAFATDATKPSVKVTPYGTFDLAPGPGARIIPRNFGQGPGYFVINLAVNKSFGLGHAAKPASGSGQNSSPHGKAKQEERPYRLTLGMNVTNILNHTNPGAPIGNLTSPLFGIANSLNGFRFGVAGNNAYNRSVILQAGFNF
jgi:hypothetical protein